MDPTRHSFRRYFQRIVGGLLLALIVVVILWLRGDL